MRASVRAQAKLNLTLRVLGRDDTGYHQIETIFHRLDFGDDVVVTLAEPGDRALSCSVDVAPMRENLAYRAATAYCGLREWTTGFHINITKRIPAGGGLGGGSADAAAVLRILDALHPDGPIGAGALLEVAARLGADVPFLASDAVMAVAWGYGTRFVALPGLPPRAVALVFPEFRVATGAAYAAIDAARAGPGLAGAAQSPLVLDPALDLATWNERLVSRPQRWAFANDFHLALDPSQQEVARRITAVLAESGANLGGMTGSGSTFFGIFDEAPDPGALHRALQLPVVVTQSALGVEAVRLSE